MIDKERHTQRNMGEVDRCETGIKGLDNAIQGGFPRNSITLVTGGPGSGKTTFSTQFIQKGLKNGEKCLYITTGQRPKDIKSDAAQFGLGFDKYGDKISFAYVSPSNHSGEKIKEEINEENFDRIVLDSLSVFEMHWGEKDHLRKYINKLIEHFRDINATVLVTSELPERSTGRLSRLGIAEFVVDGVIRLQGYALGETTFRSAQIVKMRRTKIDGDVLSVEINDSGICLSPEEKL
jgi:KaiC/GvpD/RAD55 family RecA-like ATPase